MVKTNWRMLFGKKSLPVFEKAASFQQVSNDLPFVELRGTGEELQTKNMWPKFNMKTRRSSPTIRNAYRNRSGGLQTEKRDKSSR